jgi:hypothetical protein
MKIDVPKKRFKIYERINGAFAEVIFSYPVFTSLEEAFRWINYILDPYYTGQYGVGEDN